MPGSEVSHGSKNQEPEGQSPEGGVTGDSPEEPPGSGSTEGL